MELRILFVTFLFLTNAYGTFTQDNMTALFYSLGKNVESTDGYAKGRCGYYHYVINKSENNELGYITKKIKESLTEYDYYQTVDPNAKFAVHTLQYLQAESIFIIIVKNIKDNKIFYEYYTVQVKRTFCPFKDASGALGFTRSLFFDLGIFDLIHIATGRACEYGAGYQEFINIKRRNTRNKNYHRDYNLTHW
ncbi:MAG: hypothetical protein HRT87_00050 [Legionellales bacterium]|nr:hypothetical protein [Legionellales bacterium]